MAAPAAMLLDGAADMTGSTLAVILIPPAGTICLAAWLALVFYAGRDHPHGPDATRRPAAKSLARSRWLPGAFCASTRPAAGGRWVRFGADGRRPGQSRYPRRTLDRDGCRSFDMALDSICRIRSLVTP
jgi:hypothetical protein